MAGGGYRSAAEIVKQLPDREIVENVVVADGAEKPAQI